MGRHTDPDGPGIDRTQTLAPRGDSGRGASTAATDPTQRAAGTPPGGEAVPRVVLPTDDPDRYQAAGEHGRGGLGRVVRAQDTRLGRTVAVKELLRTSPQAEALFVREALITARLQHPGIVPVHEAGRWPSGEPYYVMKLVQGRTLKEVIAERATLAERLALLPHALAVAEAIGYAHSHGVIHRDVKPANVMVGDFGETVVVDWGLARDERRDAPDVDGELVARGASRGAGAGGGEPSGDRTSTVSGRVIGTPQYMPPEQARGEIVDERADVYSLGALLYEVLAGRAPYAGQDPQVVLDAVLAGPPRRLTEVAPGTPRDLDAIVAKAMARDRAHRYRNGKELAEDLKRFLSGHLVSAQTYGAVALARRWMTRHRGPVAVAGIAMLIVVAVAIYMFQRVVDERNVARAATDKAHVALAAAEARKNQLTLLQARRSLAQDPTATVAWLKAYPAPLLAQDDVPAMIDEAVAGGVARHVWRQRDWVLGAAFSPDGRLVATASKDGDIRVYDAASGAVRVLGRHPAGVGAVAFSPDGAQLAVGGLDGQVALWPAAGGGGRVLGEAPLGIAALRWSADGARLLSRGERGQPRVWDVVRGGDAPVITLDDVVMEVAVPDDDWAHPLATTATGAIWRGGPGAPTKIATVAGGVAALGVSPDGTVAVLSDGRALWRLDVARAALTRLGDAPLNAKHIAFARDGARAAIASDDLDVLVVELAGGGAVRRLRGHTDAVYETAFTRDGRRLLSASDDGTARVWDLVSGAARVLRGHTDDVYRAAFSPDERAVVTASLDGSARLWPLDRQELAIWGGDLGSVQRLQLADGGRRAIAASLPGRATAFELASGARTDLFAGDRGAAPQPEPRLPTISADGRWVAMPRADGQVALWHDGAGPVTLDGQAGWIVDGAFAPGRDVAYTIASSGSVYAWDLATRRGRELYRGDAGWGLAVSPDGKRLAVGVGDKIVLLDPDGAVLATARTTARPTAGCARGILFDPTGERIASGACEGLATVWTPARGEVVELETAQRLIVSLAFSPDGARVAGAMADRSVRVWNAATGKVLASLGGHTDLVIAVAFSPDGRRLASASYDRTVRVWDPATGASRVLRGHDGSVDSVTWTPDGAHLVTGSRDGTVRVWAAPSLAPPAPDVTLATLRRVTSAEIAVDDRPGTPLDTTPGG